MRLWAVLLCLILFGCYEPVYTPIPAPTLSPAESAAYEFQTNAFARSWYETTQEDRLAVCTDYFAERDRVFEVLDGYFDGQLLPRAFDDFLSGVCRKIPIETEELSG